MKNVFNKEDVQEIVNRINNLHPTSQPLWGTMNVAQMLAHCNVPYGFTFNPGSVKKPNFFMKWILKTFVKKIVLNPSPYKQNERTAPYFIITDTRDFKKEQQLLIDNIQKTQQLGADYFDGLENFSFGKMTAEEWNTMYYKHLDHHLRQFNV